MEQVISQASDEAGGRPVGGNGKRLFDVAASGLGLLALLVVLLGVAGLIWATSGRPILVRHERIGHRGKPFQCLKFRTMVPNAQQALEDHLAADPEAREEWLATRKLRDDPRVTPVGKVLRQLSLDELP